MSLNGVTICRHPLRGQHGCKYRIASAFQQPCVKRLPKHMNRSQTHENSILCENVFFARPLHKDLVLKAPSVYIPPQQSKEQRTNMPSNTKRNCSPRCPTKSPSGVPISSRNHKKIRFQTTHVSPAAPMVSRVPPKC